MDEEAAAANAEALAEQNKMVIVDVVIISSVEDISTAKGVNLLSGLQVQFGVGTGASATPAVAATRDLTRDNLTGVTTSDTTNIIQKLTIPAITYSLNIANAGTSRNEILARPSLVAIEGQKSEFFSGENIKASAVTANEEGAAEVERDIGVRLGITPETVGNENVKLLVEVERTFLQTPSTSVTYFIPASHFQDDCCGKCCTPSWRDTYPQRSQRKGNGEYSRRRAGITGRAADPVSVFAPDNP